LSTARNKKSSYVDTTNSYRRAPVDTLHLKIGFVETRSVDFGSESLGAGSGDGEGLGEDEWVEDEPGDAGVVGIAKVVKIKTSLQALWLSPVMDFTRQ
jgi:hypothetical protein